MVTHYNIQYIVGQCFYVNKRKKNLHCRKIKYADEKQSRYLQNKKFCSFF
jgi:hypothetical protein